jgi:cell division protein FtsW (lipid II flippase)
VTAPAAPASQPPTASNAPGPAGQSASSGRRPRTRRNVELAMLGFTLILLLCYSAAMEAGALEEITTDFWVPTAILGAIFVAAHVAIRFLAPYADPVLLPVVALINGTGVTYLRRVDLARATDAERIELTVFSGVGGRQLLWTLIAVAMAIGVLALVRDHRALSRYAYTLGLGGIVLVMIPVILPSSLSEINGAKLWIKIGGFSIQPGEFAKIMLLVFFAVYLVRKREVLSLASKRFMGIDFPRGRDLGPVVAVWLLSLMVLIVSKDLGTSLMYFGMFVVTLYIATERASWLIIGLLLFFGGAFTAYFLGAAVGGPFANFYDRAEIWLDPFSGDRPYDDGYQLVQSLLGLGTGGLFGAGPGKGYPEEIPEVHSDLIFSGIGEEIGLFGLTALLVLYLLVVERGLRAALGVRDSFGKLFAGGMAFTVALQLFVIIGGITRLIPLTGQTTPFLSAGGSSLMSNWILIALLWRISAAARNPASTSATVGISAGRGTPPGRLHEAPTEMIR